MRNVGALEIREEKYSVEMKADLSLCKGRKYFFNSIMLKYKWKMKVKDVKLLGLNGKDF